LFGSSGKLAVRKRREETIGGDGGAEE